MLKGVMCASVTLRSRRPKSLCLSCPARAISRLVGALPHTCGGCRHRQQGEDFTFPLALVKTPGCFYLFTQKSSLPLLLLKLLSWLALSWDFTTPERERPFLYMKFKLVSSLFQCLHSDNKGVQIPLGPFVIFITGTFRPKTFLIPPLTLEPWKLDDDNNPEFVCVEQPGGQGCVCWR